jgi:hypothetical protein
MTIYFLHIEFVDDDQDSRKFLPRIKESLELLTSRIRDLTKGDPEVLYLTKDGIRVGLAFESDRQPSMILGHIDAPGRGSDMEPGERRDSRPDTSVFRIHDRIWLLELGTVFAQKGFNRPAMWLERHGLSQK